MMVRQIQLLPAHPQIHTPSIAGTHYGTITPNKTNEIRTGSYPQIHHTSALLTENGWINCTEFVDANGNKYDDWIPAAIELCNPLHNPTYSIRT
ncbi:MAG: hypothetical protein ACXQTS_01115 [Candidatus Methanospirareceae archaeon]